MRSSCCELSFVVAKVKRLAWHACRCRCRRAGEQIIDDVVPLPPLSVAFWVDPYMCRIRRRWAGGPFLQFSFYRCHVLFWICRFPERSRVVWLVVQLWAHNRFQSQLAPRCYCSIIRSLCDVECFCMVGWLLIRSRALWWDVGEGTFSTCVELPTIKCSLVFTGEKILWTELKYAPPAKYACFNT